MTDQRRTGMHRVLLALWLLTLCVLPLCGQRVTSYDDLTSALAAHHVERVVVSGVMPPGASGTSTVTIRWRKGPLRRVTEVRQVVPGAGTTIDTSSGEQQTVTGDVAGALRQFDPTLQVVAAGAPSSHGLVLGWWVPSWLTLLPIGLWLVGMALLAGGGEPPLATRWAWAWWFVSPATAVAMVLWLVLVLRNRRPGPDPRPRRRLTGGWSLLLCVLFSGAVAAFSGLG